MGEVKESTHVETTEETVEKEEKEKEQNEEQNKGQDMALVGWFDGFLYSTDLGPFGGFLLGSSLERVDDIFVHHQILKNLLLFFWLTLKTEVEVDWDSLTNSPARMQRRRESWKKMNWNCQQIFPPLQSWRNLGSELVTMGSYLDPKRKHLNEP